MAFHAHMVARQREPPPARLSDLCLVTCGVLPCLLNVLGFCVLPHQFDVAKKSYPMFYVWLIMSAVLMSGYAPRYSLMHWLLLLPAMLFLDFLKACHERSPHAGGPALGAARPTFQRCLDAPSLLRYVAWRGLWLALTGLAATAFSGLRMARQSRRAGDEKSLLDPLLDSSASAALGCNNAEQPLLDNQKPLVTAPSPTPPALMPLETFGMPLIRVLGLWPLFASYERLLLSVLEKVNVTNLLQLTCLPVCSYYALRILLSRVGLQAADIAHITHEEWLLFAALAFTAGRDSHDLDTAAIMQHATSQLSACRELLSDLLPKHVVARMLHNMVGHSSASSTGSPGSKEQGAGGGQLQQQPQRHGAVDDREQELQQLWDDDVGQQPSQQGQQQLLQPTVFSSSLQSYSSWFGRHQALDDVPEAADGDVRSWLPCSAGNSNNSSAACLARLPLRPPTEALDETAEQGPASSIWPARAAWAGDRALSSVASLPLLTRVSGLLQLGTSPTAGRPAAAAAADAPSRENQPHGSGNVEAQKRCWGSPDPRRTSIGSNDIASPGLEGPPRSKRRSATGGGPMALCDDMATSHPCVTIFFSDIVGFSTWSRKLSPAKLLSTLNDLYTRLDNIIINELPSLFKVETIGDAYIVAANMLNPDPDHAAAAVRFALRAQQEVAKVPRPDKDDGTCLQMRMGLHSGPIVSGIAGKIRRRFCLYGDTVNIASRTETTCPPGCIQLTAATRELAEAALARSTGVRGGSGVGSGGADDRIVLEDKGEVKVKGVEEPLRMYLARWASATDAVGAVELAQERPRGGEQG